MEKLSLGYFQNCSHVILLLMHIPLQIMRHGILNDSVLFSADWTLHRKPH